MAAVNVAELQRRVGQVALEDFDFEGMFLAFDTILRKALPYRAAAWSTQDPATGLFTSCTMSGLPKDLEREARLFAYEFRDDEPATFRSLIASGDTVAVLSEVTGGNLEAAGRYRDLLRGFGCTDELRAVLWADDRPWGSVIFYRDEGTFTTDDAEAVGSMAPAAAQGIRLSLLRSAASRPEAVDDPPGVLLADSDGRVSAMTPPAHHWLQLGGAPLITAINAVAAAARQNADWSGAVSRLPLRDSVVLSLYASMTTGEAGDVAVIVHPARPAQVSALLVDVYGLTPRQREVLGLLLLGGSISQIARQLGISEHTANDHRKAIYARTGVSSRSQLGALLQADQYDPRTHAGIPPSPYGGFLDV